MSNNSEKVTIDLIGQIYETASQSNGDGWLEVFESLSRLINAGPGSLHFFIPRTHKYQVLGENMPPGFVEDFASTYFHILPFKEKLLGLKQGESLLRSRDCPDEVYLRSELYQDHYRSHDIFHLLHVNLMEMDGASAGITLTRPKSIGDFEREELELFASIVPHLQRALQIHAKLLAVEGRNRLFEEAWDHAPQGVVLIGETGKVRFMNRAAAEYMGPGKPLGLDKSGRIIASTSTRTAILRAMIRSVFDGRPLDGGGLGGSVRFSQGGVGDISVLVTPFTESFGTSGLFEKMAMIFIADPHAADADFEIEIAKIYGLTPSESKVAALLVAGKTVNEMGPILGISPHTARTHLKRIFGKTNTNRQAALVKLLLATPRIHRP